MSVESYYHIQTIKLGEEAKAAFEAAKVILGPMTDRETLEKTHKFKGLLASNTTCWRGYLDRAEIEKVLQVPNGDLLLMAESFEDDAISFYIGGENPRQVRSRDVTAIPKPNSRLTDLTLTEDVLSESEVAALLADPAWKPLEVPV